MMRIASWDTCIEAIGTVGGLAGQLFKPLRSTFPQKDLKER